MTRAIKRGDFEAKTFSFLDGVTLNEEDIEDMDLEWWIPKFMAVNAIAMIYSTQGQGKSYFAYAVAKHILMHEKIRHVFYLDGDNGKRQVKQRNVGKELMKDSRFHYIHYDKLTVPTHEYIRQITQNAEGSCFEGCVFFIDSARDWCIDIDHNKYAREFMSDLKKIRKHGGTVLIIHHLTKTGRQVSGSGELSKSIDSSHKLQQKGKEENMIHYLLTAQKQRDPVEDVAFSVNTVTLDLLPLDETRMQLPPKDEAFVSRATEILKKHPDGLLQSQLLKKMGHDRAYKFGIECVKKYTGRYWVSKKQGSRDLFFLK